MMPRHANRHDDASAASRVWIPPVTLIDMREDRVHVLLWQIRGATDISMDGHARTLSTGYALWIPAGTPHDITVRANSVMTPLFFELADTATTLREPTLVTVDRDLRTLMLAYNSSWATAIQHSVNLGRQILSLIEEQPGVPTSLPMPRSEPARAIAEALRFNPGDGRSLEELADSVHTSTRSIERFFLSETGMTLRRWRIRSRMETAAMLLRSDATVEAVAMRVGYTNVNAFRRVFGAHFGMSPTVFSRRYAAQ